MLSMSIIVKSKCPNCSAPVAGDECLYCGTLFQKVVDPGFRIPKPGAGLLPRGLFELQVGEARYGVLGQLAQGQQSRVFLARRARAVTEQVVIKLGPSSLEREWATLRHLQGRRHYLDGLLPHPVHLGNLRGQTALVTRWRSGFVHTLEFARRQYAQGVPAKAVVWMWNRILDQLICLQDLGYTHGDLRLEHLLVHPRDHGIAFCGWGQARLGEGDDVAQSGSCVLQLLGPTAPFELVELAHEAPRYSAPQELQNQLKDVARMVFGPPRFEPFVLPR